MSATLELLTSIGKEPLVRFLEEKRPKTPEQVLHSHGIITVVDWLKDTARNAQTNQARLTLTTVEGDVHIDAFLGENEQLELSRPSRQPDPHYGRIAGKNLLRIVVLEQRDPATNTMQRQAYLVQIPEDLIQSHTIDDPQSKTKVQVAGVAEQLDRIAQENDPEQQKILRNQLELLLSSPNFNECFPDYYSSPREIVFAEFDTQIKALTPKKKAFGMHGDPADIISASPLLPQ